MQEFPEKTDAFNRSTADEAALWEKMIDSGQFGEEVPERMLREMPAEAVGKMVEGFNAEERLFVLKTILKKRSFDSEAKQVGLASIREKHAGFLLARRNEDLDVDQVDAFVQEVNEKIEGIKNSALREQLSSIADYWSTQLLRTRSEVQEDLES